MAKSITCSNPKCRTAIRAEGREVGDRIPCPKCGTVNQVLADFGTAFEIPELHAAGQKVSHPARLVCTNCGAVLGVRAAVCPKCGGDVRTGKTIMRVTKEEKQRAGLAALFRPKAKTTAAGAPARSSAPLILGAVVACVVLLIVLGVVFLVLRK